MPITSDPCQCSRTLITGYVQQIWCSGDEWDVREQWRTNICSGLAVPHLCQCTDVGNGDALRHGMDEVRETFLRKGEVASLEMSYISDEELEVCTKGSKRLDGQRINTHVAMVSQDITILRLLGTLTTLVSNTSAVSSGRMSKGTILCMCSDNINAPLDDTCGVFARHIHDAWT